MRIVENMSKTNVNNDIKHVYSYRLIENEFKSITAYGIEVERKDYKDGVLVLIERDCVKNISCYMNKIKNLVDLLYKHEVSPIHLIDIIGEYVDEYVRDFNMCA